MKFHGIILLTSLQPTYAAYCAEFLLRSLIFVTNTTSKVAGDIYFQHNNQKILGREPVMYSISFAKLNRNIFKIRLNYYMRNLYYIQFCKIEIFISLKK